MNYTQISYHLDYVIQQIHNNGFVEQAMEIVHNFSGWFIGTRNYLADLKNDRITKTGILNQLKEDLIEQSTPIGPNSRHTTQVGGAVIMNFMEELTNILYQK